MNLSRIRTKIDRLNTVNLQLSSVVREKAKEMNILLETLESQKNDQGLLIKQKNEISWELESLRIIEKKWKSEAEELHGTVQELHGKIEARQSSEDTRNRQYRFYLDNLNRTKKELRDQCAKLIQEMKASAKMNPMRDL